MWLTDEAKIPRRAFNTLAEKAWFLAALIPWRAAAEEGCRLTYYCPCGTSPCRNHGYFCLGYDCDTRSTLLNNAQCLGPSCYTYLYMATCYCTGFYQTNYFTQCCKGL
jgi:hypothetical protein